MLNPKFQIPCLSGRQANSKQIPNHKAQNSKRESFGDRRLGYWVLFGIWCLTVGISSGCARIHEAAKGIAGVSTKALEDGRKTAITKTFNYDYNTCYDRVKKFLVAKDAYVYAENKKKRMLAIYVTSDDTTPVGVFFKEIGVNTTQIEVSSPSTYAKEFIYKKILSAWEEPKGAGGEKGKTDEKKEMGDKKLY